MRSPDQTPGPPLSGAGESESAHAPTVDIERVLRTCPVCGSDLAERKCKLYCPRPGCGYFLSCADYH